LFAGEVFVEGENLESNVREVIAKKIIIRIKIESTKEIFKAQGEEQARKASKHFFGRVFSVLDKARKNIQLIRKLGKELAKIPQIQADLPTAIIAGMPNVGKTTVLARITGSKPKVAEYPFTTQGLMIGKFEYKYQELQIVDTPGLLDRDIEKRNKIEQRAIAALKHLGKLIVFIVDPSESCGYDIKHQYALYRQIRGEFSLPVLVVINKADLVEEGKLEEIRKLFAGEVFVEGENLESNVREVIAKKIIK